MKQSRLRQRYGLSVVAIRWGDDVIISPQADKMIRPNDILVVLGRTIDCQKLRPVTNH